jgi:hypothetical protein
VLLGMRFWLRNVAQAEMCAMERYRGGFASPLTTDVLVAFGLLLRADPIEFTDMFLNYCWPAGNKS